MHGRFNTKHKRSCTNAIQPETLGNGFLFAVFFSPNLDFTLDPSQVFCFLVYLMKITFWASKSGFSYSDRSCVGFGIFKQIQDNPDEIGMVWTLWNNLLFSQAASQYNILYIYTLYIIYLHINSSGIINIFYCVLSLYLFFSNWHQIPLCSNNFGYLWRRKVGMFTFDCSTSTIQKSNVPKYLQLNFVNMAKCSSITCTVHWFWIAEGETNH